MTPMSKHTTDSLPNRNEETVSSSPATEPKFTTGPLKIREEGTNSGKWLEVYLKGEYYSDGSEFVVAQLGTVKSKPHGKNWVRTDEASTIDANAHLFAAAPDLYKALEACVERLQTAEKDSGWGDGQETVLAAQKVLAAARGEGRDTNV